MRKIVDNLLALQKLQFDAHALAAASKAELENLLASVPPPILAHYYRLVARGKKGVAFASSGVCSECHLRITSGKLLALFAGTDIQRCDNCGRYLHLPEEETTGLIDRRSASPVAVNGTS